MKLKPTYQRINLVFDAVIIVSNYSANYLVRYSYDTHFLVLLMSRNF